MKLLVRLTAAITLLAVVTVIAEAGQPDSHGVLTPALNQLSVVQMNDRTMADGGRPFEVVNLRCSGNRDLDRVDARGDPIPN
ncbi:MAG: hypothetical protein R3C59_20280 [Planctomycetaceae bacterium]